MLSATVFQKELLTLKSLIKAASKKLFMTNASHSLQNADGNTALHRAAENGDIEVIKNLLQQPIYQECINIANNNGDTALHLTAYHSRTEAGRVLLNRSANPNSVTSELKDLYSTLLVAKSQDQTASIEHYEYIFHTQQQVKAEVLDNLNTVDNQRKIFLHLVVKQNISKL
jgi:ankyrin repeat protein